MQHLAILFLATIMLFGCATQKQTRTVATGAVVGAAAGAAIGSQSGRTEEGAILGGMLGAAAGLILGAEPTNSRANNHKYRPPAHAVAKGRKKHHGDDDDSNDDD